MIMAEQLALFDAPSVEKKATIRKKKKRNWEDGFQRWSDNQSSKSDGKSFGCCGGEACATIARTILMAGRVSAP